MVSMSWAGQYLRAVQIDSYGQFPFILVKVSDRTSAHRLLVRGKNNASTAELYQAVTQEVHLQPPRPEPPQICWLCFIIEHNSAARQASHL